MEIVGYVKGRRYRPLDRVGLRGNGLFRVRDGAHRVYHAGEASGEAEFTVGGALGNHVVENEAGDVVATFRVEAATDVRDGSGRFHELLTMLHYTMISEFGEVQSCLWNGRIYPYFICWLRDHVHVLKGMKYFNGEIKPAIELYRDSQREDGMIWDNVYRRGPDENYWVVRFTEGDFYRPFPDKTHEFKRIPVENDVEYLFVEGLYFTWKATGDDAWMAEGLDAAKRALEYSITDEYRWSERFGLLKRGYTIDTWDFQADIDCNVAGDIMRVRPGTTRFGVMFGDNTGYATACRQLAEMLEAAGRADETPTYRDRAETIQRRLDEVSWRGTHYQMHVPEDPNVRRDLGVDETQQVSLSNAYSLNRGIGKDKARAIIGSYQRIKDALPEGSPGEWYTIYPPFERGFGGHSDRWQYMNASVTPIVAGELARGAFVHGEERYGADILNRLVDLGRRFGNSFHCSYTGCLPSPPSRRFSKVDIRGLANCDLHGRGGDSVPGFPNSPNDFRELPSGDGVFADIPFTVLDPVVNGRRSALGISEIEGFASNASISVDSAKAVYLLHTVSGGGAVAGNLVFRYRDGSSERRAIQRGRDVVHWWMPDELRQTGRRTMEIGWKGKNDVLPYIALCATGVDNPRPERELESIDFEAAPEGAIWHIAGITLSDTPTWFPTSPISFGIPNGWGAAAVVYALIEGLAGVVDATTAFENPVISPRWEAADETEAEVCVHYPASDGYVAYRYRKEADRVRIELTGSGQNGVLRVLLPDGSYHEQGLDDLRPQVVEVPL